MKNIVVALLVSSLAGSIAMAHEGPRHSESTKRHNVMELVKYSGLTILDAARGKMELDNAQ